ncbi:hypothetical protein CIRMBP1273_01685 [Enterococcus cecorum]|nr:hypothetical protein CIRMBP1273_01685 [Enterococcus cecorum]
MRQFLSFLVSIDLLFILAGCQSTASKSAETHESTQKTSSSRTVPSNSTITSTQQATTQTISKTYQSLSDIPKTLTEEKQTWQSLSVNVEKENQLEATFIPETFYTQAKDEWTEKYTDLKAIPKTMTQANHTYHLIRVQLIGEVFEATFTSEK